MQYRFYLDGNLINENPSGWDQMTTDVNRDKDIKGVLLNLNATLTFTSKNTYDYLKGLYDDAGYCNEVELIIERSTDEGLNFIQREKGVILTSAMTFDDFKCSVQCKVTDDSFYGKIDRRKSSEFYLTADKTVNSEVANITPAPIYEMSLFDPATAAYLTTQPFGCYRVYDVLNYLVGCMTDNLVEFDSPPFSISGEFANMMMTYGKVIRSTGNGITLNLASFSQGMPALEFEKLFKELDHRFNLGVFIDNSGSKPKLIIDSWNNLFRNNEITSFENLPNLKTQTVKELIYSNIKFGGTKTFNAIANSFPGRIRFLGFWNEKYIITGKCPIDNTLDLSYNFVSDTNVIEEILVLSGTNEAYDEDWFIIDCDRSGNTLIAKQSNWLTPTAATPKFYNERLSNYQIALRYLNAVPNTIAAYLGSGNNTFLATKNTFQRPAVINTYEPILFQDDFTPPNYDPNGRWDTATSTYTAVNDGSYSFELRIRETYWPLSGIAYATNYYIERYDSLNNLIERRLVLSIGTYSTADETVVSTFNANAGDYFIPTFKEGASFNNVAVEAQSHFACINAADGGGRYQTYDPEAYPIKESSFITEIKSAQVDLIRSNPLSLIRFYVDPAIQRVGWISQMQINEFQGVVNAKLLSAARNTGVQFPPEIRYVAIVGHLPDSPFTLSPADQIGNPASGSDECAKVFFFKAGTVITITIPDTYLGCPVYPGINMYIQEYMTGVAAPILTTYASTTVTITINSGSNYIIVPRYNTLVPPNTFPLVIPSITPPTEAGDDGQASIFCESPSDPSDYTFAWSGPGGFASSLQSITAPAGSYTCIVTYLPGTFDTNVMTFHIEIPISLTGS